MQVKTFHFLSKIATACKVWSKMLQSFLSDHENITFFEISTSWKVSKYGVFPGPNTGKYGPEKLRI